MNILQQLIDWDDNGPCFYHLLNINYFIPTYIIT